jgi:hypothetical protein
LESERHVLEQRHVVLDRRELAEDLVVCDVSAFAAELDECINLVLDLSLNQGFALGA